MRKLITLSLASIAATPAMAHPAAGGVHLPHAAYLVAVGVVVAAAFAASFVKR